MLMDFWSHLILNHLTHVNHALWASDLLEIIHIDVCGLMSVETCGGYGYFLTFADELSRYGYIYLMKHKSKMFGKFKQFRSEVENHRTKKIKFL